MLLLAAEIVEHSTAAAAKELRTDEKEFQSTVLKLLQPGRTRRITELSHRRYCTSSVGFGDGSTVLLWGSGRADLGGCLCFRSCTDVTARSHPDLWVCTIESTPS